MAVISPKESCTMCKGGKNIRSAGMSPPAPIAVGTVIIGSFHKALPPVLSAKGGGDVETAACGNSHTAE